MNSTIAKILLGVGGSILLIVGVGVLYSKNHTPRRSNEGENIEYIRYEEKKIESKPVAYGKKWTGKDVKEVYDHKDDISKKAEELREAAMQEIADAADSGAFDGVGENVEYDIFTEDEDDDEEYEDAMYEDIPEVNDDDIYDSLGLYPISESEFGEQDNWDRPIYFHYFRDDDTLVEQEQWTVESGEAREKIVGDIDKYFMDDDIDEKVVYLRNEKQQVDCQITGHNCSWVAYRNGEV